jgi:DNA-binding response OmpR family regulator
MIKNMQKSNDELVLVIEDDPGIAHVLETILNLNKINVLVANNGSLGLQYIKEKKPQIILCDIMLPDMEGYDILKIVKEDKEAYKIPFIFLTAFADPSDVRRGMNEGADDYITKPFTADTIINAIQSRLEIYRNIESKRLSELAITWKSLLSYNFNHEYMAPLNGIIDGANILINNSEELSQEKAKAISAEISTSSYSLIRNIQKIMIYSKLQVPNEFNYPEHIIPNLNIILFDAINKLKMVFMNNPIEFKINANDVINVQGNFEIIKYMFDELIGNAIKFGVNTIKVSLTKNQSGAILFEVSNKCSKINKFGTKDIKAYKKFHKDSETGLGIGLYNCKKICEIYEYEFIVQCETNLFYASIGIPNKYFTKPTKK